MVKKKQKEWKFTHDRRESLKRAQILHREMCKLGKADYYRKHPR